VDNLELWVNGRRCADDAFADDADDKEFLTV
jgi:hypothetical protein